MAMVYENITQAALDQLWIDVFTANEKARLTANDDKKAFRVRLGITADQRASLLAAQDKIMARCTGTKVGLVADFNSLKATTDPVLTFDPAATGGAWFTGSVTLRGVVNRISRANERDAWRTEALAKIERDHRSLAFQRMTIANDPDPALDVMQGQITRRQVLLNGIDSMMASKEAEKAERIRDTSIPVAPS